MTNRVAVAVIHGMGSQGNDRQDVDTISFSSGLYKAMKKRMGNQTFQNIAWREIFWADILQDRQDRFVNQSLKSKGARWMKTRRFVMHNLADAASYRRTPGDEKDEIYHLIHARVHATMARLEQIAGKGTPLVVLAHSLGGHIMSNYIYDMQKGFPEIAGSGKFQKMQTMAGFVTFGCNIPVFSFSYQPKDIHPITFPGTAIAKNKRLKPWWVNLNDKDDALGMPLAGTSPGYKALAKDGQLQDRWVDSGKLWQFWNPASHNGYWEDRDVHKRIERVLDKALKIGKV
ncbi:hypothetical protein [Pseudophaeobacter sp.]|uniref:hypothetical protein n=1 Tax=Pseudophaeobacter sp. TaxID=1971739 RepID=UPI003299FEF3